jgi:hypothetical protein
MNQDEKLKKVCTDFSLLNGEQQDYILGILQALVFAKTTNSKSDVESQDNADNSTKQ